MKNYTQTPKPDKNLQLSMKWEQAFQDLMNECYYPGFALKMLEENPVHYQSEYEAFILLYDGPQ